MPCASCGDGTDNTNINPLDTCTNSQMQCGNPCHTDPTNTAAHETLPSQIENFTKQFFGEVIKTEVNGAIVWSLPCTLDTGLPNNARGATEPLACYFLRLFADGIFGTPGNPGLPGNPGAAGRNAYTATLQAFSQPVLANPQIQVRTTYNPAIVAGMHVFIETSGWYFVTANIADGTLFLTLLAIVVNPPATIAAGCLVLPAGAQGLSVPGVKGDPGTRGPKGLDGDKGDQGDVGLPGLPGPTSGTTNNNGQYHDDAGTLWQNPNTGPAWTQVQFTSSNPEVTLTVAGTYLLTVTTAIQSHTSGVAFSVRLYDTTAAAAVAGTEVFNASNTVRVMPITAVLVTAGVNHVVRLEAYGKLGKVYPENTTITFVQLS
jgi:hypothetical protein